MMKENSGSEERFFPETKQPGIYIHIPFCVRRCIYCDFYSVAEASDDMKKSYFRSLQKEILLFREEIGKEIDAGGGNWFADSLFLGGGTPSAAGPDLIEELMRCVKSRSADGRILLSENSEITMEVNPGTVTYEDLRRYRNAGINRLSIGVQSMNDGELRFLGRIHSAADAVRCVSDARRAGFYNISVDLIFGFPGHTQDSWRRTLYRILEMEPPHISLYSLQIEEGTPLYRMFRADEVEQVADGINRAMYHDAVDILESRGYQMYEISNASLPGHACRHNLKYWSMCDYAGFGASAHSYRKGARYYNEQDIVSYIRRLTASRSYMRQNVTVNTEEEERGDAVFTCLRRREGMDLSWFDSRFAGREKLSFLERYGKKAEPFLRDGSLILEEGRLRFSRKGVDISNYIIGRLLSD